MEFWHFIFGILGYLVAQQVSELDYLITHTSLSPIRCEFAPCFVSYKKGCTRLTAASDKVYQLLAHGRWFFSRHSGFFHHWNWLPWYNWNIAECGVKHNKSLNHHLQDFRIKVYRDSECDSLIFRILEQLSISMWIQKSPVSDSGIKLVYFFHYLLEHKHYFAIFSSVIEGIKHNRYKM